MKDALCKIGLIFIGIILTDLTVFVIAEKFKNTYKNGFEAGKLFLRDSLIAETDSLLGCSQNGYLPDSIKTRNLPELKNGGSYKIKGKK